MSSDDVKKAIENQLPRILEALDCEGDRGCVLVAASMVENVLAHQIRHTLLPPIDSKNDELMGRSASSPIASFSAKINLAYRLNLMPSNERKIYHLLRELRNDCAHEISSNNFDQQIFKNKIVQIIKYSTDLWNVLRSKVRISAPDEKAPNSIEEYVEAIGWRKAFTLFFSLVIAVKEESLHRVICVDKLYQRRNAPSANSPSRQRSFSIYVALTC